METQHFHRELNEVRNQVAKLGGLVELAIGKALTCIKYSDSNKNIRDSTK